MASTDWFQQCGWGVLCHYLVDPSTPAETWNRQVDAFDVDGLARQLHEVGARYFFLTLGQGSGHYCAPNETYDAWVGAAQSKLSRRNLVLDLATALDRHKIPLLLYITSDGPWGDTEARKSLELHTHWSDFRGQTTDFNSNAVLKQFRLPEFQRRWETICREWSIRFGESVRGYWVDGSYFKAQRFPEDNPPNLASLANALRAGNPDAILSFNGGVQVPISPYTIHEDFTAGEISRAFPECPGPFLTDEGSGHRSLYHVLSHLGDHWGHQSGSSPRFPNAWVVGYTQHVTTKGGVVTWDTPIMATGKLHEPVFRQLRHLGSHLHTE